MALKWLAFGLRAYFGDGWNWLDCFIVSISIVGLSQQS
jgi:hypothetical protein